MCIKVNFLLYMLYLYQLRPMINMNKPNKLKTMTIYTTFVHTTSFKVILFTMLKLFSDKGVDRKKSKAQMS